MIDRRRARSRRGTTIRTDKGDGLADRQDKNATHQRGCMVVRSATMIMPRTAAVIVVAVTMGVGHTILVGGNFPMLEGMRGMGYRQKGQAGQPKDAEMAPYQHAQQNRVPRRLRQTLSIQPALVREGLLPSERDPNQTISTERTRPSIGCADRAAAAARSLQYATIPIASSIRNPRSALACTVRPSTCVTVPSASIRTS